MEIIGRETLKQWMDEKKDFVLVEPLNERLFRAKHLPGAHNVPVEDEKFEEKIRDIVPDKGTPVVVYCMDAEGAASVGAAKKLDELGYEAVYDYEAGKQDWEAAGYELETD